MGRPKSLPMRVAGMPCPWCNSDSEMPTRRLKCLRASQLRSMTRAGTIDMPKGSGSSY
jgi:hypothetical protein